jgi:hypothetical protein
MLACSNSHFEAMISKNVGQAVSLSGLEQANSLSYDTLTAKMRIAGWLEWGLTGSDLCGTLAVNKTN